MKQRFLKPLLALVSGALLAFAFAPFNFPVLAFFAPACLCWLIIDLSSKQAFYVGWLFGLGLFGIGVSWVYVSIHTYGHTEILLAALMTFGFIAVLSLFPACGCALFKALTPRFSPLKMSLLFPLTWVAAEWARAFFASGFPWLLLGYTQIHGLLNGFLPLMGSYGVSFIVSLTALLLVLAAFPRSTQMTRLYALLLILIIFSLGWAVKSRLWTTPSGKSLSIALIQGNISQTLKWDPNHFEAILNTYQQLTEQVWGEDLIIWPEGAIPAPVTYVLTYLNDLATRAQSAGSALIIGTLLPDSEDNLSNGMLLFGSADGQYEKRHLVPFGEYLPFTRQLHGLIPFFNLPMSNLRSGAAIQPLLRIKGIKIAPTICYEIAFAHLVWLQSAQANLLLNISDDSWFGSSIASAQQEQIAAVRARETGRPLITVNNNGLSAFISPMGTIIQHLPLSQQGILKQTIQGYTGQTPLIALITYISRTRVH